MVGFSNGKDSIDSLLQPFKRFGVNLGLGRIQRLLNNLGNPHQNIPIIHVAGTNGKGSVCAYLSSILTEAVYKVGRYTSPHLIDWNERICVNETPIDSQILINAIAQVTQAIALDNNPDIPTQFEVFTAAAWLIFAQQNIDIAVIETGLGGRLDATNVCDRPLVSIITSISREHWQVLGNTLTEIAGEKAGIIKANCPVIIGKLPLEAQTVMEAKITELNCPAIWVEPALLLTENNEERWALFEDIKYPLPLLGEFQLINSALAIATIKLLQKEGWKIPETAIINGMNKTRWLGRLQWLKWHNRQILIDGAHNPAAAQELGKYVNSLNQPVNWIMGILATKDHQQILEALLRPQDQLYLIPVPDHATAEPETLAKLARNICPTLQECQTFSELFLALEKVKENSDKLIVICGSLYLIGYFLQHYSSHK